MRGGKLAPPANWHLNCSCAEQRVLRQAVGQYEAPNARNERIVVQQPVGKKRMRPAKQAAQTQKRHKGAHSGARVAHTKAISPSGMGPAGRSGAAKQ
jgi:hypothetical protein